jgi:hypothetical protein
MMELKEYQQESLDVIGQFCDLVQCAKRSNGDCIFVRIIDPEGFTGAASKDG